MRWFNSESLSQQVELAVVLARQLVARVNEHLHLWAETPHRLAIHVAPAGEALGRICPLLTVSHLVDTAALRIPGDRMDVDLKSVGIDHHKALRRGACNP